jgi:hypothetical protein
MADAILSIKAFIIKVKRPRVIMLIGRVRIRSKGLKKRFKSPMAAAAKKADKKPLTLMFSRI